MTTATLNKQNVYGPIERSLRAFSNEQAQRAIAALEVAVPVPGISAVISTINFVQHSCAAFFDAKDGNFTRGIINALQGLADIGQVIAGFFPVGETLVDVAAFGLEFADKFVDAFQTGARGARPSLRPPTRQRVEA